MQPKVGIVMGSDSDWEEVVCHTAQTLRELGVPFEARVLSAHRTPERLRQYVQQAERSGIQVLIAAAGGAAHLPGVIAAGTQLPVIGVPVASGTLGGLDALLSIAQMPGGVPVATMAIGPAGARNAALFATRILAVGDPELRNRLEQFTQAMAEGVAEKDARLQTLAQQL